MTQIVNSTPLCITEMYNVGGVKVQPILGLTVCEELGQVTRTKNVSEITIKNAINKADLRDKFPDVFEGTGLLEDDYHLVINPNITPVVHGCQV